MSFTKEHPRISLIVFAVVLMLAILLYRQCKTTPATESAPASAPINDPQAHPKTNDAVPVPPATAPHVPVPVPAIDPVPVPGPGE